MTVQPGQIAEPHKVPPAPVVRVLGPAAPIHAPFQRCLRCGTEESRGSHCSWCQMAAYVLIDHTHSGHVCPLGPYRNPSFEQNRKPSALAELARDRAEWDATHDPAEAEPFIVLRRHHPANPRIAGDAAYLERHPGTTATATTAAA